MPTQTFNTVGLDTFLVPAGVTSVTIRAVGASGGDSTRLDPPNPDPGLGASIQGDFAVVPGQTLTILVGGTGETSVVGGGGGGSFVWSGIGPVTLANLLVAAGGGGGAGCLGNDGDDGQISPNGTAGGPGNSGGAGGVGGTGGIGGNGCNAPQGGAGGGGAGGGILTNGGNGANGTLYSGGQGGTAISAGGAGGLGGNAAGGDGGFGGGGGAGGSDGINGGGAGGGGGYSGGGGGRCVRNCGGGGGGGGSFNGGINQVNQAGVNMGNGFVEISWEEEDIADLAVEKTASTETINVGQPLTYSIIVTNNGPSDATGVVLNDVITGDVVINSVPPGCVVVDNKITCKIGNLAAGENVELTFIVTPTCPGTITNTATVTGDQEDPDLSNNTAIVTTRILARQFVHTEVLINGNLVIPCIKPPVECLLDTKVDFNVTKAVIFDTPLLAPECPLSEIEIKKVLILGIAKIIVKYAADVPDQQVHAAHFEVPFHALIEWLGGPTQGTPLCVEPVIEKRRFCLRDGRTIEKLILLRLDVYSEQ